MRVARAAAPSLLENSPFKSCRCCEGATKNIGFTRRQAAHEKKLFFQQPEENTTCTTTALCSNPIESSSRRAMAKIVPGHPSGDTPTISSACFQQSHTHGNMKKKKKKKITQQDCGRGERNRGQSKGQILNGGSPLGILAGYTPPCSPERGAVNPS